MVMNTWDPRDKWNNRFLDMANFVASWSKDPSTKCGAVIVRPDLTIASTGFNGFPRRVEDDEDRLNHRETKYKYVVHAELNAILSAKEDLGGYAIYVYPFHPCSQCAAAIIQAGILYVYYDSGYMPDNWVESTTIAKGMLEEAGVVSIGIDRPSLTVL